MIKLKINNQSVDIPTSWDDLSFKDYLYIIEGHSLREHISHFCYIDMELLEKAKINVVDKLLIALAFVNTKFSFPEYVSKIGPYELPVNHEGRFDPRFESLGQFEDMRAVMLKIKKVDDPVKDIYEAVKA